MSVLGLSVVDETTWTTRLAREPRLIHDSMANLTCFELLIDCPRPPQQLAVQLDTSGEEHPELSQGPRWLTLLQAAMNLKVLRLRDISAWSAGFDNLLQLIFESATWPNLIELSIRRKQNIGLLPFAPHLFDHSPGWYLFLQKDLDRFLVRHKHALERMVLRNIVGLTERLPPAPISLQWLAPGFPPDPKPSLAAFERSLQLWKRELRGLAEADVAIAIDFYGGQQAAVDRWLEESETQALDSSMGFPVPVDVDVGVAGEWVADPWGGTDGVVFYWGAWVLGLDSKAV